MNYKVLIAALLISAIVHAEPTLDPLPDGYVQMGNGGGLSLEGTCDMGVDSAMAAAGEDNISIYCGMAIPSFGGLLRRFDAEPYRGKRVRYSAWIKGAGIEEMGGPDRRVRAGGALWITVGSPGNGTLMNNMGERSIRGYTSWEYRDFVVDVPEDSGMILLGFWIQGHGQFWIRDQQFEIVNDSVPVNLTWIEEEQQRLGPNLSLE
jgi:hypothetical protein